MVLQQQVWTKKHMFCWAAFFLFYYFLTISSLALAEQETASKNNSSSAVIQTYKPLQRTIKNVRQKKIYAVSYKSGLLEFVFPANGACRTSIEFCQFWSLRPQISKVGWYTYNTSLVTFWIFLCNFFWSNVACRWPHPYLHPYHPTFPPPWFTYKMKAHWTYQALATYSSYVQAQTFQICIFNFSQFWRCGLFPAPP